MREPAEDRHADGPTVEQDGDQVVIRVPMKFRKRGGRTQIIVPEGLASPTRPKPPESEALVVALARAHQWRDGLESGRYASISELARDLDVHRTYVGRVLRLALLAPDIVMAILRGDEPSGLSFRKLQKIPFAWSEQRSTFCFPHQC